MITGFKQYCRNSAVLAQFFCTDPNRWGVFDLIIMDIFYHFPGFYVGRILLLDFTVNLFFSRFDQIGVFSCAFMCYFPFVEYL